MVQLSRSAVVSKPVSPMVIQALFTNRPNPSLSGSRGEVEVGCALWAVRNRQVQAGTCIVRVCSCRIGCHVQLERCTRLNGLESHGSTLPSALLSPPLLSSPLLSSALLSSPLLSSPVLSSPLLPSPLLSCPLLSSPRLASSLLSSRSPPLRSGKGCCEQKVRQTGQAGHQSKPDPSTDQRKQSHTRITLATLKCHQQWSPEHLLAIV